MTQHSDFTRGKILAPLVGFAAPAFGAMILQSLYGAVDLYVVGRFAAAADVSAVSTGAMIMHNVTHVVVNLSVGVTILLGQYIGAGRKEEGGSLIGTGIRLFGAIAAVLTVLVPLCSDALASVMNAPAEAFEKTSSYVAICGGGFLFIGFYNLLGAVFRGMGDSKTPLMAVSIAAVFNIFGDLYFVKARGMGAAGAAVATVAAQALSIIICLFVIARRGLPFSFGRQSFKRVPGLTGGILKLGIPIALQGLMVGVSFMVITAIVNDLGLVYSAGMGVAEKVCSFIMLVSEAFSQAVSAFTAQNIGAGNRDRAKKALKYAILVSLGISIFIAWYTFFYGDRLTGIFTKDPVLVSNGWDYLRAYAIDTVLTSIMFCLVGFFNGCGYTKFVMLQGIFSAFCIRIPVSYFASRAAEISLFRIGLATPASSLVQIFLCLWYFKKTDNIVGRKDFGQLK